MPWGRIYVDRAKADQVHLEQNDIPTVWHRLTSIANVGVSEPGRASKMGVYGSDMACI